MHALRRVIHITGGALMQSQKLNDIERRRRCLIQLIATGSAYCINAMYYKSIALLRLNA